MANVYPYLLSPIKVRNLIFKSRIYASNSMPHYLQGPEPYPNEAVRRQLINRARNGAAYVTVSGTYASMGDKKLIMHEDAKHFPSYDMYEFQNRNYFVQLVDAIHNYGSKASLSLLFPMINEYDVSADPQTGVKELTRDMIERYTDCYVEQAVLAKKMGFDMGTISFAYRGPFGAGFLSPLRNKRTDEYNGSLENRAKVLLDVFRRIKAEVGEDFVLEGIISGEEPKGGNTLEDTLEFAKLADGLLDILQVRMPDMDPSHPTGFNLNPTPTLHYAHALKKLGLNMKIAPIGGFHDPATCEAALAEGKADLLATARGFIRDPEFGRKLKEGRGEDVIPCIRCNKCHLINFHTPNANACSVNPVFGIEHDLHNVVMPVTKEKKVAVIGGGPGGMQAAIIAAERGHKVTLFEKSGALGGQLKPASAPDFKWALGSFLDYQIRQTNKAAIDVRLNTEATPSAIEREDYDVVIAAVGAKPILPKIPGIDSANVMFAVDALSGIDSVKGEVVVIGGGEIGMETAIYIGKNGHKVTVLEMKDTLASEAVPMHYISMFREAWEAVDNLSAHLNIKVTGINGSSVSYTDANGEAVTVKADTVVIAAGTRSKTDEALSFYNKAGDFYIIGDCDKPGSLMSALRNAFYIANSI